MSNNQRKYIVIGLIAIVIVYSLYNIFLAYASYSNDIPRKIRHINRFICIAIVYGIGCFSFKRNGVKWITDIWNLLYIFITCLLVFTGLYDWLFGPASLQLRSIAKDFVEFLISPLLFVALFAISKTVGKVQQAKQI